jgi:hypothetical protein
MNDSTREMITGIVIFGIILGAILYFSKQKDDDYYYSVEYYKTDGSAHYDYVRE